MIEAKDNQYKSGTVALGNQDKIVDYDNVRITGPGIPNLNASAVDNRAIMLISGLLSLSVLI